jgi:hypothetical protein
MGKKGHKKINGVWFSPEALEERRRLQAAQDNNVVQDNEPAQNSKSDAQLTNNQASPAAGNENAQPDDQPNAPTAQANSDNAQQGSAVAAPVVAKATKKKAKKSKAIAAPTVTNQSSQQGAEQQEPKDKESNQEVNMSNTTAQKSNTVEDILDNIRNKEKKSGLQPRKASSSKEPVELSDDDLEDDPFSDTVKEALDKHLNRKGKRVGKNSGKDAHISGPRPPAGSREEHKWLIQRVEETRHLYNPIRTKGNAEDGNNSAEVSAAEVKRQAVLEKVKPSYNPVRQRVEFFFRTVRCSISVADDDVTLETDFEEWKRQYEAEAFNPDGKIRKPIAKQDKKQVKLTYQMVRKTAIEAVVPDRVLEILYGDEAANNSVNFSNRGNKLSYKTTVDQSMPQTGPKERARMEIANNDTLLGQVYAEIDNVLEAPGKKAFSTNGKLRSAKHKLRLANSAFELGQAWEHLLPSRALILASKYCNDGKVNPTVATILAQLGRSNLLEVPRLDNDQIAKVNAALVNLQDREAERLAGGAANDKKRKRIADGNDVEVVNNVDNKRMKAIESRLTALEKKQTDHVEAQTAHLSNMAASWNRIIESVHNLSEELDNEADKNAELVNKIDELNKNMMVLKGHMVQLKAGLQVNLDVPMAYVEAQLSGEKADVELVAMSSYAAIFDNAVRLGAPEEDFLPRQIASSSNSVEDNINDPPTSSGNDSPEVEAQPQVLEEPSSIVDRILDAEF